MRSPARRSTVRGRAHWCRCWSTLRGVRQMQGWVEVTDRLGRASRRTNRHACQALCSAVHARVHAIPAHRDCLYMQDTSGDRCVRLTGGKLSGAGILQHNASHVQTFPGAHTGRRRAASSAARRLCILSTKCVSEDLACAEPFVRRVAADLFTEARLGRAGAVPADRVSSLV